MAKTKKTKVRLLSSAAGYGIPSVEVGKTGIFTPTDPTGRGVVVMDEPWVDNVRGKWNVRPADYEVIE